MTLEQFQSLARQYTAWTPKQQNDLAAECFRRQEAGESNTSLWHVAATMHGKRCFCADCNPQIRN